LRKDLGIPLASASALALILTLLYVGWQLAEVFLLSFGGLLLAVVFRGLGLWLNDRTGLPTGLATGFFWTLAAASVFTALWLFGPDIATGLDRLVEQIPNSFSQLQDSLNQYPRLQSLLQDLSQSENLPPVGSGMLEQVGKVLSTAFGLFSGLSAAIAGLLIMVTVGLYASLSPGVYVHGLTAIEPRQWRSATTQILQACARALRWWMLGRILSMSVVGLLTWSGLWALDIPAAATLAVLAGGLSFVPNIGPIVSAFPAILVGLSISPSTALSVVVLYVSIQLVESYLLTPMIQQKLVSLPAALVIVVQLAFGALFGLLGVLFATPLTLVAAVLINQVWIRRVIDTNNTGHQATEHQA